MTTTDQWRAHAASDADRVATRSEDFVNAVRHDTVRTSIKLLAGPAAVFGPRDTVRAHVVRLLADSVERQARISGLGRIEIPTGVPA